MKKILLSSIVLLFFALSITIFQLSCQKDADAENEITNSGLTQLNKVVYVKEIQGNSNYTREIWIANYDGSGNAKVNIILPSGVVFDGVLDARLSPDGKKIFFNAGPPAIEYSKDYSYTCDIYLCNVDGSNVTKIVDRGGSNNNLNIAGAY